ncbi:MAG: aldehyde dehydrogenase [Sphingomonadales bacterium]|nr:aldehyde dehydrogenase [Sphingomonadales bacterium]
MQKYDLFINGAWQRPESGEWFDTHNPFTGEPWARIPRGNAADAEKAVAAAHTAFTAGPWSKLTATARGAMLRRLGDLIARDAEKLAATEVRDNGKLYAEMLGQVKYLPQWYYYYGGLADKIEGSVVPIDKDGFFTYTRHEPLGVIVAITPWNSPLLLATLKLAPALAAGNTVVLKPSEFTSASALEFVRLVTEAGFPDGVINVVTGLGGEVGAPLVAHPKVAKIAFTGGEQGGIAAYESAARGLKDMVLELGGKSPNIVFDDAIIDNAVKGAIAGIFAASGQTCIAGSRLLVQDSIYDVFLDKLVAFAKTAKLGDPMHPDTQVGPVTTPAQHKKILDYIAIAKGEGARCVLGGGTPTNSPGPWFVEPTIFAEVTNDMRIAREEVFGPVLSVIRFRDEEEAVAIANDTPYGLAAGIWTENVGRALRVEKQLRAGTVWVNAYRAMSFMMPFGGFKRSGLGRENGIDAIREYLETKSVWINTTGQTANPFVLR